MTDVGSSTSRRPTSGGASGAAAAGAGDSGSRMRAASSSSRRAVSWSTWSASDDKEAALASLDAVGSAGDVAVSDGRAAGAGVDGRGSRGGFGCWLRRVFLRADLVRFADPIPVVTVDSEEREVTLRTAEERTFFGDQDFERRRAARAGWQWGHATSERERAPSIPAGRRRRLGCGIGHREADVSAALAKVNGVNPGPGLDVAELTDLRGPALTDATRRSDADPDGLAL